MSRFDYSAVKKMYEEDNMKPKQIADIIGCKERAIYHYMERTGIKPKGQKVLMRDYAIQRHMKYKEPLKKLLELHIPCPEIAERLNTSTHQVHKMIIYFGFPKANQKFYKRELNANWKGGYKQWDGYIRIRCPEHPYVAVDGYLPQHRLVMEEHIGRYLLPNEHVHHIDGDKSNNKIENLELLSPNNHHTKNMLCSHCPLREEIKKLKTQLKSLPINGQEE